MSVSFKEKYGLLIGGEWRDASDGATFDVTNPANGEHLTCCAEATERDVDDAVKAAWAAFPGWKATEPQDRAAILNKIADRIDENAELLAAVETLDNGKPLRETTFIDVPWASEHFRYFAGAILTQQGTATILNTPNITGNALSIVLREPIGVVGQIVPWNFPFLMAAWKLAPVLAAGDCTVIKSSSTTPLSLIVFMELINDLLPAGVINVINGKGSRAGQYMLDHPGFRKLAFTGSTEVGLSIARAAAEKLIPATLELGGKSANIYFDDCNFEQAIDGLQVGILFNQGQVCCAGSRVFVQEGIYDRFMDAALKAFSIVKQGDTMSMETQIGAQVNEAQVKKIASYIDIARQEGATIACGGERNTEGECAKGCFFKPTLITDVTNDMRVAQEEIFGPIITVYPYDDDKVEETVRLCDETSPYGLTGAVFGRDRLAVEKITNDLCYAAGNFYINDKPTGAVVGMQPFGGARASGTNDKAGGEFNLIRWIIPRVIKETLVSPTDYRYTYLK